MARNEPQVYAAMSDSAVNTLQSYCSMAVVQPRLQQFILARLAASAARSTDPLHAEPT